MKHFTKEPELSVKAYSMRSVLYSGSAFSISAKNRLGPFDILPGHANLISILSDCELTIETPGGSREFSIVNGLLKVSNNSVSLFVDL